MRAPLAHAQHGEDIRIDRVFGRQRTGFYIDIGAGHPVIHSLTHRLYRRGWHGINVEPVATLHALLELDRPRDVNVRAVVGDPSRGPTTFYETIASPGMSTAHAPSAVRLRDAGFALEERDVDVVGLARLVGDHVAGTVDMLKVDVEGGEGDVLRSADWTSFRPRLVIVEANEPAAWEPLLEGAGYLKAASDGVNHWFVEPGERDWIEILSAPLLAGSDYELAERRPKRPAGDRPRMLIALSSENQLYSGTGRVVFETFGRLTDRFAIELAIDDCSPHTVALAQAFCSEHQLPLHVGPGVAVPEAPDRTSTALADVVADEEWELVVAISWANAGTNGVVLDALDARTALAYLPLHQPSWSIPLTDEGRALVDGVHRAMLRRADVVLCLSPWERGELGAIAAPFSPVCAVVSAGCDVASFTAGAPERDPVMLFVGDHQEPRKRFDRVVATLAAVREQNEAVRLVVIGNHSERAVERIPDGLRAAVTALGYVDEARLRAAYREAAVLVLLSEFEAFGLPVVEALASATPVVMSRLAAPETLFGHDEAVRFVAPDDIAGAAAAVIELMAAGAGLRTRLASRRAELTTRFDWSTTTQRTAEHLLAAWARRCRATGGFAPMIAGTR